MAFALDRNCVGITRSEAYRQKSVSKGARPRKPKIVYKVCKIREVMWCSKQIKKMCTKIPIEVGGSVGRLSHARLRFKIRKKVSSLWVTSLVPKICGIDDLG